MFLNSPIGSVMSHAHKYHIRQGLSTPDNKPRKVKDGFLSAKGAHLNFQRG